MAPLLTSANCWAVLLNFIIYHISHITYLKAPWNLSNQKSRYSFLEIFSEIILATLSINEREIVKKNIKRYYHETHVIPINQRTAYSSWNLKLYHQIRLLEETFL